MSDAAAQKKRLKLHKDFLTRAAKWKWNSNPEYLKRVPGYDPGSLERAAAFFGLDHADPSHLLMLTHIVTDVVFGKRRPGRQKGDKITWDHDKVWDLWWAYDDLKIRHPDYKDNEIAELICDREEFNAYKRNPERIRQLVSKLHKRFEVWESDDSEVFKAVWSDDNAE
jgi:hypothetical protein